MKYELESIGMQIPLICSDTDLLGEWVESVNAVVMVTSDWFCLWLPASMTESAWEYNSKNTLEYDFQHLH